MAEALQGAAPILPPDHAERARILTELDRSLLVEASAGTGKTTSMVGRMVALIREGKCTIDGLAAITFTRKSAAELRARFQLELERGARSEMSGAGERLQRASAQVDRCFIGTVHSFCARLLRERPMEARVDLAFRELEEQDDRRLRGEAWDEFVAEMFAQGDPLLDELNELGLEVQDLSRAFQRFADFPDVDEWPARAVTLPDLGPLLAELNDYAAHMRSLAPTFPAQRGGDKLMGLYERLSRLVRLMDTTRPARIMQVLTEFTKKGAIVQKYWPGKGAQAKQESARWQAFGNKVEPILDLWYQRRYEAILRVLRPAVAVYDRRRQQAAALNFQDLLLKAAALLRDQPAIRSYFRRRFTHLLVDEFQDTDPIQAEVMLLLCASDPRQTDWRKCRPVPGSLFVVGDPKQSIYRFRRADIVTYQQVKELILHPESRGAVISLTANFRTTRELVAWGNEIFDREFPDRADRYSPERRAMQVGRIDAREGELAGVHRLSIEAGGKGNTAAVAHEAEFVARTIRAWLDGAKTVPRASKEVERGVGGACSPGDFLIVTRFKKHLPHYARELQRLSIPHEVTGGSALGQVPELALVRKCLAAVAEPDDPVALVAVLRGELFGLSDAALYAFRHAGGRFDYRARRWPDDLPQETRWEFEAAFSRMQRYASWFRRLPFASALERMARDLGLTMRAAAASGGSVRAGGLMKALELLRAARHELNSLTDLANFLGELLDEDREFDALPLRAHEQPVVRLMNLHQVKGLEAPVVFLSDPTGKARRPAATHIDRSGDTVRGYMAIYAPLRGHTAALLARPTDWNALAEEEDRFQEAEEKRLMYVAATRAGAQLTVVQRQKNNTVNPWSFFDSALANSDVLADPAPPVEPVEVDRERTVDVSVEDYRAAAESIAARWSGVRTATYEVVAAKSISVDASTAPKEHGPAAAAGEYGAAWGTVIHLLLETALRSPGTDLRALAEAALEEQELSSSSTEQALETIQAVMNSEIWRRASSSGSRLVEVPFQLLWHAGLGDASGAELELQPTMQSPARERVVRGVIDLVFQEDPGWVIVDYKTDRVAETSVAELVAHYRTQVRLYAKAWEEITGQRVVETGLFLTRLGRYVVVSDA